MSSKKIKVNDTSRYLSPPAPPCYLPFLGPLFPFNTRPLVPTAQKLALSGLLQRPSPLFLSPLPREQTALSLVQPESGSPTSFHSVALPPSRGPFFRRVEKSRPCQLSAFCSLLFSAACFSLVFSTLSLVCFPSLLVSRSKRLPFPATA